MLVTRAEAGLSYGTALPSKHDAAPAPQDAIPGTCEDADGDSEEDVEEGPAEEDAEAPEPFSVTKSEKPVDPDDPWGAGKNLG